MNDAIRVGTVSSINYEKGLIQVTYADRENAVSGELPCFSHCYDMPEIGDKVVVIYMTNSNHEGFVLGKYYNEQNLPIKYGKGILHKPLQQYGSEIEYQQNEDNFCIKSGTIVLKAKNIVLQSDDTITLIGKTETKVIN